MTIEGEPDDDEEAFVHWSAHHDKYEAAVIALGFQPPALHYRMAVITEPDKSPPVPPVIPDTAPRMAPSREALAAIFTDITQQLDTRTDGDMNGTRALNDDDMNGRRALLDDSLAIARMDAHVRAILASADPMLYALNTWLGHQVNHTSPPPLTDDAMTAEIEAMYKYYHDDTSSSEDESLYPYAGRPPLFSNDRRSPPRTQPYVTTSTPHYDLDIRFEVTPQAMEGSHATPSKPPDNHETMEGSSSVDPLPPLRPRASWMIDDEDKRTEEQAATDWHRANDRSRAQPALHPPEWQRTPPAPLRNRFHHCLPLDGVLPHPPTVNDAPPFHPTPEWGPPSAVLDPDPNLAHTNTPWQPFYWGDHHHPHGPEPEPLPRRETRRHRAPSPASDSGPDEENHLQSYAQPVIESSFKGGTTVNAICSVRDPHHARNPLAGPRGRE